MVVMGLRELKDAFRQVGDHVGVKKVTDVALAGNASKNDVQSLLQYLSGTLRRSAHVEMQESDDQPVALVGTNLIYARQREYGGIIRAKNAPYLVFKINGVWVHTKFVYQPPHPVWRPVLDQNHEKYRQIILKEMALS